MNNVQPTGGDYLHTIGTSCTHLLQALHQSPEAVLSQIFTIESACQGFAKSPGATEVKSNESTKMIRLVGMLHGQMGTQGLMDDKDFEAFRKNVVTIQSYANSMQRTLAQRQVPP